MIAGRVAVGLPVIRRTFAMAELPVTAVSSLCRVVLWPYLHLSATVAGLIVGYLVTFHIGLHSARNWG